MASFIGNISTFDHTSQEFNIYISRFRQFAKINKISQDAKTSLLLTYLTEDTYRLARDLLHPEVLEDVGFEKLVGVLGGHLAPKRCLFAERAKFYGATRVAGESVEEWAARLRGLAVHCEFGATLDMLLRDKFVLGMSAGPERDRLFEADPSNLPFSRALEVAQQAASARLAREATGPSVTIKDEAVFKVGAGRSDRDIRCEVCGLKGHSSNKCRFKKYRCSQCGVIGHLKKVCKSKKQGASINNMPVDEAGASAYKEHEQCEECKLYNVRYEHFSPILLDVSVDGIKLKMELDSGSGTTVISEKLYNNYFRNSKLIFSDVKMCLYNGHKITPEGFFIAKINYLNDCRSVKIFVIKGGGPPLLGRDFMSKFNVHLMSCHRRIKLTHMSESVEVSQLLKEYQNIFDNALGKFNKFKVELKLKSDAIPKFFKPRTVPFALKERVEDEIDRLVGVGILIPVNHSSYATPIVPVLKENGKIKIAGDFSITLNKDLFVDKYPMPRIEEVFARLGGGEKFTNLDLSNAYNQFELEESSQHLTTINTCKGLYKYTRLVYGLANAPAIFQRAMETLLNGIEGVSCWLDDICVTGPDRSVHLHRLRQVLGRISAAGLKLQREKCSFFQDQVTYLGFVIDKTGLRTCQDRVKAIVSAPTPTNILEVKRFLGVVNYYRNFVPNASSIMSPLHSLLRKDANWVWGEKQQRAFDTVKKELCSENVLAHYLPGAQLVLSVDASPSGLGAVLCQCADAR